MFDALNMRKQLRWYRLGEIVRPLHQAPGRLRPWLDDELLSMPIHDIWGHQRDVAAWQLQIMLVDVVGEDWVSRRSAQIRGPRNILLVNYYGIPCVRIEVQLLYKAHSMRPNDEIDFMACLSRLDSSAKQSLFEGLCMLYQRIIRGWLRLRDYATQGILLVIASISVRRNLHSAIVLKCLHYLHKRSNY